MCVVPHLYTNTSSVDQQRAGANNLKTQLRLLPQNNVVINKFGVFELEI